MGVKVMETIKVLDTNVILHDAHAIYKLGRSEVVIPAIVLEEIDSKKRNPDEVGRNARLFSRIVDELRREFPGELNTGVPLETGGTLRIELNHISFEKMEKSFSEKTNDNRIIAVALNLKADEDKKSEDERREVTLITNDMLAGIKGDALGINVEKYENDRLIENAEQVHKGYQEIYVTKNIIDDFYENEYLELETISEYLKEKEIFPQDFIIMKCLENSSISALGRIIENNGKRRLVTFVLDTDEKIWNITARNAEQRMFMELLMDDNVELVCGVGPAGTGKTLLALAASLALVEEENLYKKILVARPVIPMGKDIGFLPGDMNDKLRPWMQPIFDNLEYLFEIDEYEDVKEKKKEGEKSTLEKEIEKLPLEIEALTYIRGRSIPKQFIILDEVQNMSPHEIKTVITRAGEGTKIILLGDPDQIDHPYLDATNNALTYVIEKMKHLDRVGVVKLEKTERSKLADLAAKFL